MNIFDKRPLLLIITAFISGFVGFTFSDGWVKGSLLIGAILLLILSLVFYFNKIVKNLIWLIIPLILIVSMAFSYIYFDLHFKIYERYDEEVQIEGIVISIEENPYSSTIIVQTTSIQEKSRRGHKLRLYLQNYSIGEEYEIGSKISFKATLYEFDDFYDIDATSYYFADGISADARDIKDLKHIGQESIPIASYGALIRGYLLQRAELLSGERAGALFSALFLGERDMLDDQIKLDFKRLGITHVLALSGLHLSIISLGISKVLTAVKIKKKPRLVIVSVFILTYMILTGLSVSVVRAGIMLLISSALFLLGKTKDSITSLSIAVLVILIISPYSVYDLTLWLSALSTLGIVAMGDLEEYKPQETIWKRALKAIFDSLKASLFATSATLLITITTFGAMSLASAIATFLFSILAEIVIYIGMLMLIFGKVIPFGFILNYISEATYWLAGIMSKPDWIYLCTDYVIIILLVAIYTFGFAIFLIFGFKNKKHASAILAICFIVITILSMLVNVTAANEDISICTLNENGDRILLRSNSKVALICSADYSSAEAYISFDLLTDYKITYLNEYYITNYTSELLADIEKLTSLIKIDKICLPAAENEEEEYILEDLFLLTDNKNTEICVYNLEEEIVWNEYTLSFLYRSKYADKYEKNAFKITKDSTNLLYLSPSMLLGADKIYAFQVIAKSNAIIFGCNGYKDHTYINFDVFNANIMKIYVGNSKLTIIQDVFWAYKERGTEIYRDATFNLFN